MVGLIAKRGSGYAVAPGVKDLADIKAIVDAVAPKPVNVLLRFEHERCWPGDGRRAAGERGVPGITS